MRLAVIDCGTNTFNLLILEVSADKKFKKLFSTRASVRLGATSTDTDKISDEAFTRGLEAIKFFKEEIGKYQTKTIIAIATSGIREATNGADFVRQISELYDIQIEVIDGLKEAELIYGGVKEAVKLKSDISLIMDIGGGSTEFILANKDQIFWKESFMVGVARLLRKFPPSDPITCEEIEIINSYLSTELQPLIEAAKVFPPVELIGSSGAFESIIEMIEGELGGEALQDSKTEYLVTLPDNAIISEMIINSTLAERKKIRGLVPIRFDMIVISCITVNLILRNLKLNKLRVSTYSVKEGALMDYLSSQKK